jgi:hypothetical protein
MKVISTTDLSREGNDCYIYQSISLVEAFGMYTVIDAEKVIGSWDKRDISCTHTTSDLDIAKHMYMKAGGILETYL